MSNQIAQIKQAYNQVAYQYLADRQQLRSNKYLTKFLQLLKSQSHVLDLGCGAGIPIDDVLLKKGHLVTGLDIAEQQIKLAKKSCPQGEFIVKNIADLEFSEYQADAVVSFYTIFHLPRNQHLQFLQKINSFLPPGGLMLITMGDHDFEGWHDFYGVKIWSSHYGSGKNKVLVEQAGFEILLDEIDKSGREKHQIILGRKR